MKVAPATSSERSSFSEIASNDGTKKSSQIMASAIEKKKMKEKIKIKKLTNSVKFLLVYFRDLMALFVFCWSYKILRFGEAFLFDRELKREKLSYLNLKRK